MRKLLIGLIGISFIACSQANSDTSSTSTPIKVYEPLHANRLVRPFSNRNQPDTLSIVVNGESILTGEVYLQITDHEGQNIHSASFPARVLIGHRGPIKPSQDEKEVKRKIDNFFASDSFTIPNTSAIDSYVTDSLKAVWREVQADPMAVYFSYQAAEDSLTQITYSNRLRKVILMRRPKE